MLERKVLVDPRQAGVPLKKGSAADNESEIGKKGAVKLGVRGKECGAVKNGKCQMHKGRVTSNRGAVQVNVSATRNKI